MHGFDLEKFTYLWVTAFSSIAIAIMLLVSAIVRRVNGRDSRNWFLATFAFAALPFFLIMIYEANS